MLRRAFVCIGLSLLLFAPGCKKKQEQASDDGAESDAPAKPPAQPAQPAQPAVAPTPDPTPQPTAPADSGGGAAAGSGGSGGGSGGLAGSGGGAPTPREDLTCDPLEQGACLEGEQCIGAQGCDAVWTCDADIVCKKGVKEYCGCDGRTFEAVFGNCPWKKYAYEGPCK